MYYEYMSSETTHINLIKALAILQSANRRTKTVKGAIRYIEAQLLALPANWLTFHESTAAAWTPLVELPTRKPDFVSQSGSQYWNAGWGVIRLSDHWGRYIKSCDWFLRGARREMVAGNGQAYVEVGVCRELRVAYCEWADFEKLVSENGVRGSAPHVEMRAA